MWHKEIISDKTINHKVTQGLAARGMRAPCSIAVQTTKGVVTLSGNIEYEHQRNTALQAVRHLDGVSRVVDQLHVKAKTSPWKLEPAKQPPTPIAPKVTQPAEQPQPCAAADPRPVEAVTAAPTCDSCCRP
jgi:hypothetical protein